MSDGSAIQWTDATWNPTTGCTKVSPGCAHCYIERTPPFRIENNRFVNGKTDLQIFHDRLEQPLHWKKRRRVFVNSLSDLFHEDIGDAFIDRVFGVMALTPQHTYQILTKRAARMLAYFTTDPEELRERIACEVAEFAHRWKYGSKYLQLQKIEALRDAAVHASVELGRLALVTWPFPNIWLGVSVENQHFADERIPLLLQTPAAVRFISAEPLLERLELAWEGYGAYEYGYLRHGIDWVIVGGESGPGARPFDLEWARSLIQQCQATGVACFVKQLGAHAFEDDPDNGGGGFRYGLHDKKGGDPEEWPVDLRVREFPKRVPV